jgi:hypothetical protein
MDTSAAVRHAPASEQRERRTQQVNSSVPASRKQRTKRSERKTHRPHRKYSVFPLEISKCTPLKDPPAHLFHSRLCTITNLAIGSSSLMSTPVRSHLSKLQASSVRALRGEGIANDQLASQARLNECVKRGGGSVGSMTAFLACFLLTSFFLLSPLYA